MRKRSGSSSILTIGRRTPLGVFPVRGGVAVLLSVLLLVASAAVAQQATDASQMSPAAVDSATEQQADTSGSSAAGEAGSTDADASHVPPAPSVVGAGDDAKPAVQRSGSSEASRPQPPQQQRGATGGAAAAGSSSTGATDAAAVPQDAPPANASQRTGRSTRRATASAAETAADQPAAAAGPQVIVVQPRHEWAHYRPLVQRNMFTRTQASSRNGNRGGTGSTTTPRPEPPRPRASWILTGVAIHEDQSVAFFENSLSSLTIRVEVGKDIGEATLQAVGPDFVAIRTGEEKPRRIRVGETIDGSTPTLSGSPRSSIFGDPDGVTGQDSAQGSQAEAGAGSSTQSAAERMRARRQQQMNR